jgi:arginase
MYAVISSPTNLGLRPSGVERLPDALREAGLQVRLGARDAATIHATAEYDAVRSPETGILNGPALRDTAHALARAVADVMDAGDVPIVLAGDCSVVLGALLGTRMAMRSQRVGLLFIDGHVDFYQPEASPTGEVADMDLAIATGRGPTLLTELDGAGPLVRDEDVVAVGARDAEERDGAGSQDVRATGITLVELPEIRERGIDAAADVALAVVAKAARFWCHIDADVLDDAVMPAVDYRQPGGLKPAELATLLRRAVATKRMAGVSLAIYNPALDLEGRFARVLVDTLVEGLA